MSDLRGACRSGGSGESEVDEDGTVAEHERQQKVKEFIWARLLSPKTQWGCLIGLTLREEGTDKGGNKMKKLLFGTILLTLAIVVPIPTMAAVNINIDIPLPPPIVFAAPPEVIVMPDTNVYVDPDIDVDLFFWNGWWWRFWEGRWYRSHYYDRAWVYYNTVPSFYFDIDPGWRGYYREHDWHGHRWNYERIPYRRLEQNWKSWRDNRHWERRGTWGVQGYRPPPQKQIQELRHQRQEQYQQRPEVQRHREQIQEQQRNSQVRKSQGQQQRGPQVKQPKQPQHQPQVQQQHPQQQHPQEQPHGKPQGGEAEHRK